MSPRLLGIKIASDSPAETQVFASLLGHRQGAYDAHVLFHAWPDDSNNATRFAADALVEMTLFDTGWRPNPKGQRGLPSKIVSRFQFRQALPAMLEVARNFNPDVIYSSQQRWDCLAATYIAQRLNKPQIIHLHYNIGKWLHKPVLERLLTVDHVITVSDFIRQEAWEHGIAPERVTTIHNAIPMFDPILPGLRSAIRAELNIPLNAPVIGIVARLDTGKGQDDTIAAFAKIAPEFPDAYLVIVGDGLQRAVLEEHAAKTGFASRIRFTGFRDDIPNLLASFDIFAHPSRREPFGLAIAEASAAGLPVLAYAEGGVLEIVNHGITGLLAIAGDVISLTTHLRYLLSHPEIAHKMGQAGKARIADEFRPSVAAQTFSSLVENRVGMLIQC